jgi:tetratricopeptide (TPR) repeat protein
LTITATRAGSSTAYRRWSGSGCSRWRWEEPVLGPAQPDPGKDLIDHEELRHDPALAAARCACALIEAAAALEPPWGFRAGLELGAVVAGIVGHEPYQHDIWGDTVNVACRLCDHGEAGQLLGWYYYSRKEFDAASEWFDQALQIDFSLKALEGFILTLREGGDLEEARDVALEYSSEDYAIAKLYIEIASSKLTDEDPAPVPAAKLDILKR